MNSYCMMRDGLSSRIRPEVFGSGRGSRPSVKAHGEGDARLTLRNRAEGGLAAEIRWRDPALGVPEAPEPAQPSTGSSR